METRILASLLVGIFMLMGQPIVQDVAVETVQMGSTQQESSVEINLDILGTPNTETDTEQLEWVLSCIDGSLDDWLAYRGELDSDCIDLLDMQEGSFTQEANGRQELFVHLKLTDTPHAYGFDRRLVAIIDSETGELLAQQSFGGDETAIHLLPDEQGQMTYLLVTLESGGMGEHFYYGTLYHMSEDEWVTVPLPEDGDADQICYTYIGGYLSTYEVTTELNWDELPYCEIFYELIGQYIWNCGFEAVGYPIIDGVI